jgi:hypothetical protein
MGIETNENLFGDQEDEEGSGRTGTWKVHYLRIRKAFVRIMIITRNTTTTNCSLAKLASRSSPLFSLLCNFPEKSIKVVSPQAVLFGIYKR